MAHTVRDVMTASPVALPRDTSIRDAAARMRDEDIGDVLVLDDGEICGILTDRDIVVRAIADGRNPDDTPVGDVCSGEVITLEPDASADEAVRIMRDAAVRRVPVVDDGETIGIVAIGDLAVERDRESALADISAAPANT